MPDINALKIEQIEERLGVLDGTRGRATAERAVRVGDVAALVEFSKSPRSGKAASNPPTKAEFDVLVDDVHEIFRQMAALSEALRLRGTL